MSINVFGIFLSISCFSRTPRNISVACHPVGNIGSQAYFLTMCKPIGCWIQFASGALINQPKSNSSNWLYQIGQDKTMNGVQVTLLMRLHNPSMNRKKLPCAKNTLESGELQNTFLWRFSCLHVDLLPGGRWDMVHDRHKPTLRSCFLSNTPKILPPTKLPMSIETSSGSRWQEPHCTSSPFRLTLVIRRSSVTAAILL